MHEHREKLHVPVMASVGQAFNILAGRQHQAPQWMREHGLEWLFRLFQEPRRLWRRYLVYGAQFPIYLALDALQAKGWLQARSPSNGFERNSPRPLFSQKH